MNPDNPTPETPVKPLLDHHADALDAATAMRLQTARQAALSPDARRRARSHALWLWTAPLATAASVGLLALGLDWHTGHEPEMPTLEDVEVLAAHEPADLIEDYEFYQWLPDEGSASEEP